MTSPTPLFNKISVIGAGAWGTALATIAARAGCEVTIWALEDEVVEAINQQKENTTYLKGIKLPEGIEATNDLSHISGAEAVLMVAPAQHVRSVLKNMAPHLRGGTPIALCSKGIEQSSGKLMTTVLEEECPTAVPAVLSGPSFASDVAIGLPTAVTLACADEKIADGLSQSIGLPTFRVYQSDDLIGAEIGGSVKNVLAIACGIVAGKELGESARAALMARGFSEIQNFAEAMGGKRETLAGLSGLGDLILTASSTQSRNMSLGVALGEGRSLEDIMAERNTVAEGVHSAKAVVALADEHGVDMPISRAVATIVGGAVTVNEAIDILLTRPFKDEIA